MVNCTRLVSWTYLLLCAMCETGTHPDSGTVGGTVLHVVLALCEADGSVLDVSDALDVVRVVGEVVGGLPGDGSLGVSLAV